MKFPFPTSRGGFFNTSTSKIFRTTNRMAKSKAVARGLQQEVLDFIKKQGKATFNYRQVAEALGADSRKAQKAIAMLLIDMAYHGDIIEVTPGVYKALQRTTEVTGTFVRRSNGRNSVVTDTDGEVIEVAERNSMHALNGDRVRVMVAARRKNVEPEAEVVEIIEEKEQVFIGTLKVDRHMGILKTDSKFLAVDILIPKSKLHGGKTGDKAIVKIIAWEDDDKNPIGEVVDILGKSGENNAEIHAILAEFGLPYKYPENVEKAANEIGAGITPEEVARREDLRGVTTFTIDPVDAKDFDDALSFRKLPNGNYEIGVHIADVTHYVRPGSIIDKEGEARATSVYLVDRVVPMLPEHLSNGICSLRPDEDKLTFSVIFEMNDKAKVINHRICKTVTRSVRRFTYEEAQEVIETGKGDLVEEITTIDRLAKILRQERYDTGAMDFDREEIRFDIDDKGHPIGVHFKVMKDANKLIEEFMLLANRTVAQTVGKVGPRKKAKAFVYRVHDKPDEVKLQQLAKIAAVFGYRIKTSGSAKEINRSINKMLTECKGKGEEDLLSTLAIRSMQKAIYSTDNIGHYGLCFDYYTHFTSPIRRYPDMLVHRLLERYMDGGRSVNAEKLEDQCKHCSAQEQLAANAERASIKYKQVEYMADHLGETYWGVISGVTEWGIYVELDENGCEGLVPVRDLAGDYYEFDERNFCLVGRRYNNRYRLGDRIQIQVARADVEKKQLDFTVIDDAGPIANQNKRQSQNNAPNKKSGKAKEGTPRKKAHRRSR